MNAPTIVLAPDSYKGSASALEVAEALGVGLQRVLADAELIYAPMADGGEGTLDCVAAACPGDWHTLELTAIHGKRIQAAWYVCRDGLAVIESASVLGLPLIELCDDAPPLAERGSTALGELIRAVLDSGARDIAVGLGGSACNDAGLGLLMALGADARDADGAPVPPTMAGLLNMHRIDLGGLDARLAECRLRVLCDVDNPLLGERGASRVYGPQKGLTEADIAAVEAAFERMASDCGTDAEVPGTGAAGGLGFALAVLGGRLEPGAETLMRMSGLHERLRAADVVITGEGRSDTQTLSGKLPMAIAQAAAPVPAILVAGAIAADALEGLQARFERCYTLVAQAGSVEAALDNPDRWLREIGERIGRDLAAAPAR